MRITPTGRAQPVSLGHDCATRDTLRWKDHLEYGLNCRRSDPITKHMNSIPQITDRASLERNRQRAKPDGATILHDEAIADIQDRLSLVNRDFTDIAIVTGHPEVWSAAFPTATIVSDDETLGLEPNSKDLVIHAMCLHWANDPVGQIIQCRRALRPDGLFLSVAFGGQTLFQLREALAKAEVETKGGLSPRVAPMAELRDMGALLQRAGLALPVADSLPLNAEYRDVYHLMRDLRAMGEANALADRYRSFVGKSLFDATQRHYSSSFPTGSGRLPVTYELIFLLGWAPDESQQQPLRPGSATASLAQALGTTENPLKD